ncbi:flagellar hook assembly protein FlgD [Echinimonas agarilytica]|uniref:Basal-body rod modification protein FlgD n=1 Tax=Echinimonas agarilytica TaxID=1215918 RepID=A0AA42B6L7_9GAMM|nr:flagellar hook assembly protein FlgD [Echinimonas agarilytica]MCM2678937.1 flagellar hook assembly protein FlgD [Echinimonas agarilytica]
MSIDTSVSNPYLDSLRIDTSDSAKYETEEERSELSQEDFFSLLTQQLAYQDPFKPVENAEMISQMTSFSTAEGITKLNDQITDMNAIMSSSQALQASTLVGQKVLVPASTGHNDGDGIDGIVAAELPTNALTVTIEDEVGQVIKTISIGDVAAGTTQFEWDGTDLAGNPVAEGNYVVKANGFQDGKTVELASAVYAKVESVSLSNSLSEAALNLSGLGSITLSDVLEVAEG